MVHGKPIDTTLVLTQLINNLESFKSLGYDYVMDAKFPNGDKDHIKGEAYSDNDKQFLYNNCDAYTMVYTKHWFYNADHRKKIVTVVNLDKNNNKKLKKATRNDILQNGTLTVFLDSIVLKKATIKKIKQESGITTIVLGFPKSMQIQELYLVYDTKNNFPVSYTMNVFQPMQKTASGIQGIKTSIKCSNFKKVTDLSVYNEHNYFSYNKGKLDFKKYNEYKLSTKM